MTRRAVRAALAHPARVILALALVNAAWCVALFAAPATLPAGTVAGLEGRENHVDHFDAWLALPPVHGLVYAVGDLLCHQKHWRSLEVGGNQFPIDERMTAIFLAALPAMAWGTRMTPAFHVTDAIASALPRALAARLPVERKRAARVLTLVVVLALAPAAVDVLWENLLGRESTRGLRFVTGALAGVAGGLVLAGFATAADHTARHTWRALVAPRWPRVHRTLGWLVTPRAPRARAPARLREARARRGTRRGAP